METKWGKCRKGGGILLFGILVRSGRGNWAAGEKEDRKCEQGDGSSVGDRKKKVKKWLEDENMDVRSQRRNNSYLWDTKWRFSGAFKFLGTSCGRHLGCTILFWFENWQRVRSEVSIYRKFEKGEIKELRGEPNYSNPTARREIANRARFSLVCSIVVSSPHVPSSSLA